MLEGLQKYDVSQWDYHLNEKTSTKVNPFQFSTAEKSLQYCNIVLWKLQLLQLCKSLYVWNDSDFILTELQRFQELELTNVINNNNFIMGQEKWL